MSKDRPKVMYASDEAAKVVTVTGWMSSTGHFWGKNEHMARYDGCTHDVCVCGVVKSKSYSLCDNCSSKRSLERYLAMPYQEWDEEYPVMEDDDNRLFMTADDVLEYCECHDTSPEDMRLVICEPQYLNEIELDDLNSDNLCEDSSVKDIHPEIWEAVEKVNEMIRRRSGVLSWCAGKFRTSVKRES